MSEGLKRSARRAAALVESQLERDNLQWEAAIQDSLEDQETPVELSSAATDGGDSFDQDLLAAIQAPLMDQEALCFPGPDGDGEYRFEAEIQAAFAASLMDQQAACVPGPAGGDGEDRFEENTRAAIAASLLLQSDPLTAIYQAVAERYRQQDSDLDSNLESQSPASSRGYLPSSSCCSTDSEPVLPRLEGTPRRRKPIRPLS